MSAVEPPTAITLDVWSDVVHPWCYITKHRLHKAINAWERPHEVEVRHRAYELDPALVPGEHVPVAEYHGRKYGGGIEAGSAMNERIEAVARHDDLELDLSRAIMANSFDAHRLIALARAMGGPGLEQAALERLFSAHFVEGLAVDDHSVLQRISAEAGLDERRVSSVLPSDDYADSVRADEEEARRLGIATVPFVLVNGRVGSSGAQSVETYLELFRKARGHPSGMVS